MSKQTNSLCLFCTLVKWSAIGSCGNDNTTEIAKPASVLKLHPTHSAHTEVHKNFPCGFHLQSLDWKTGPVKVMTVCSSPIEQVNGLVAMECLLACLLSGSSVGNRRRKCGPL